MSTGENVDIDAGKPAEVAKTQADALAQFDMAAAEADLGDGGEVEDFTVANTDMPEIEEDDGAGDGDDKGDDKKPEDKKPAADAKPADDGELEPFMKRRLARQERKHEREMAELRAQVETLKAGGGEKKPAEAGPAPVASDFADFEDYMEAKAAHELKLKSQPKTEKKPDDKPGDGKADVELVDAIADIKLALDDTAPDLWAKVTAKTDLQITRDMALALADLDAPATVLQHLLDNPDKAAEIATKTPRQQIAALAKLDGAAPEKKPDTPLPKRVSSAPAPIKPLDGQAAVEKSYDTMDFNEFETKRRAEARQSDDFW